MEEKVTFDILSKKLLYDNVLVRAVGVKRTSDIPMVEPTQYEDKPEVGVIVSTGNGRLQQDGTVVPLVVNVDDVVLFNRYSATKYRFNGIDYYIIREEDIVAY